MCNLDYLANLTGKGPDIDVRNRCFARKRTMLPICPQRVLWCFRERGLATLAGGKFICKLLILRGLQPGTCAAKAADYLALSTSRQLLMKELHKTMMNSKKILNPLLLLIGLALGGAACGSDIGASGDNAFLSIQGSSSESMEPGFQRDLTVKYHDATGSPLAGEVTFEVVGSTGGASLSVDLGATDAQGNAGFTLFAGQDVATFQIIATAPEASPVEWTITVEEGQVDSDMDIRGTYNVVSSFDVANGLPGTVGDVVNIIVDMTDDPFDPATYLIDTFDNGGNIDGFRPLVDQVVFDLINDNAPGFVVDLLQLGTDFGDVVKNFGVLSTIAIAGDSIDGTGMTAVHTVKAYQFNLDGETHIFTMDDLNVDEEVISDISVTYDNQTGVALFATHEIPLRYGAFLVLALEEIIIPRLDPDSRSLNQYLFGLIDCTAVGQAIFDQVDIFDPNNWKNACEVAVEGVASIIIEELREIDEVGQVKLVIEGKTRMRDPSGDLLADEMTRGNWSGTMDYLGSMGPLAEGSNPFSGTRINAPSVAP